MGRVKLPVVAAALLVAAACSTQPQAARPSPGARAATPATSPSATAAATPGPPGPLHFQVSAYASGLEVPWSIAFLPGGGALVTERPGRVRLIQDGQLRAQPALSLNVVSAPGSESGLLGIALHPGFPNPADVYLYYTYRRAGQATNRVSRFHYADGSLTDERVVLDGILGGSCCHFGGRIGFGLDGMLYVTVGDGQQPARAVDRDSPNGKVLRVRDDGSVPADDPFPGSPVWAWGLRNPEGLAWDSAGRLYVSSNGPTGEFGLFHNDEIDLVQRGAFYGWPVKAASMPAGRPQDYGNPPDRVPPVAESGNSVTWAPSGMAFYTPDQRQQQTLLVATLSGQALRRFVIDPGQPDRAAAQEVVLSGYGRLRDVVSGPDGCAYALTSNRDGRGTPQSGDDRVLRLCPTAG
jgi:glucose/arabinose dehydrogenase